MTNLKNWGERLGHWIKTQHGTAGWQMKLENLMRNELQSLAGGMMAEISKPYDEKYQPEDQYLQGFGNGYRTSSFDTLTAQKKFI